ncbi:response regulator transcription factor [Vibrio kyushuensis]|uniref:response regulator transcription factor n=1 Tax=Vibrio kyushuensis TaxID=2910249 RepID=UPI003D128365
MQYEVIIITNNDQYAKKLKIQLSISFTSILVQRRSTIRHELNDSPNTNLVIIYDSESLGDISDTNLESGYWLNVSPEINASSQMQSLMDGFSGIVKSNLSIDQYPQVLRSLFIGEIWYSRHIIAFAIRKYQSQSISSEEMTDFALANMDLTLREQQLARLLVRGQTNQEIADHLFISIHTVKTHVSRILNKLSVHSRSELQGILLAQQINKKSILSPK